jgi:calcineurin-binding protein cabin-1
MTHLKVGCAYRLVRFVVEHFRPSYERVLWWIPSVEIRPFNVQLCAWSQRPSCEAALYFIRDGKRADAVEELRTILKHLMMQCSLYTDAGASHQQQQYDVGTGKTAQGETGRGDGEGDDGAGAGGASTAPLSLTPTMLQIKFLSLKNLGRLLADMAGEQDAAAAAATAASEDATNQISVASADVKDGDAVVVAEGGTIGDATPDEHEDADAVARDFTEALRCYAAAVEIDSTDASLWRRLGCLAARRGLLHLARRALHFFLSVLRCFT